MATVTVTVHHSTTTNAPANPNVLVDGPKWDALHTASVAGLENVPNVDTTNPVNITFTQTGTGSSAVTLDALLRGRIYFPEMFAQGATISAALGTAAASVPDATASMQRCINALSALGGGVMELAARVYGVNLGLAIPANVYIRGQGAKSTVILHKPTANSTCLYFGTGTATQTFNGGVCDLVIASADTTYVKIAITVYDFSFFLLKNVFIAGYPLNSSLYYSDAAFGSSGLFIQGREHGFAENFDSAADYPIRVAINPNSATISLDSWTFHNFRGYASSAATDVITFDQGVVATNNTFSGHQNWIGGRDGFHWVDAASAAISQGLYFSGIKSEQAADVTGYVVNIQHNTSLYGLHIADGIAGERNGIKLRKVRTSEIDNFYFDPAGASRTGLNIDSTDSFCQIIGCTWLTGTTATITGLTLNETNGIITGHSSAIPSSGIYVVTGSGAANITGNAGTATAIAITDDIATNATMYPAFVSATTGNLGAKSSSTKLTFNPLTGTLNAIFFGGDGSNLSGTASAFTAGHVTTNANLTGHVTSVGNAAVLGSFTTAQLNTALSDNDVATLAGSEELTNKTLNASVGKGIWTASGTWTLPALTLGGTVSGGGNQINNVILGSSTPLAGTFTTATANSFIPNSSTVPTNGIYLPAANTLGWAINSAAELQLTSTALSPAADGGNSLGTTALGWQNLFGNTGFVFNIENSDWVATHTAGILTVGTGDLRVTTAGANSASVVTVGGTQTLTGKTLTSPSFTTPSLGVATATSINGVTIDNLAWTTYTPTVTSGGGTPTTTSGSGRYKIIGKTVLLEVQVAITTVGTATGAVRATIPGGITPATQFYVGSSIDTVNGVLMGTTLLNGSAAPTYVSMLSSTTTFWVNSNSICGGLSFEIQ